MRVVILPALFDLLPEDWASQLKSQQSNLEKISHSLESSSYIPDFEDIFKCLSTPLADTKVVILGQDPYPNPKHAMGLAFGVPSECNRLPPTLRNIFKELHEDLGVKNISGDLSPWSSQGVLLLNRTLTTEPGVSLAHHKVGWLEFTEEVIKIASRENPIAILWGNSAREMNGYFKTERTISSAHPSPLSAYRGFFGSRPFSRTNELLKRSEKETISWQSGEQG